MCGIDTNKDGRAAGVALFAHLFQTKENHYLHMYSKLLSPSLCVFLLGMGGAGVCTGHPTAAPHCPPVCHWSHVHFQRSVCSLLCPMPMSPFARWRATCGHDSCVMSYWWPEKDGYLHTGSAQNTSHVNSQHTELRCKCIS